MIFVAPEGAIADPGVRKDDDYVRECEDFMKLQQKEPLKYLLTPRYKGIQILATHAPESCFSVTMSFACKGTTSGPDRFVTINNSKKIVQGGELCTRPLRDPLRVVPDLHTIFRGGLHVFCHIHKIDLNTKASQEDVKHLLVKDYQRKDQLLANFHRKGSFLEDDDNNLKDYELRTLPVDHLRMNLTLLVHSLCSLKVALYLIPDIYRILSLLLMSWLVVSIVHALSHLYAEQISGASRESLLFETIIKHLLRGYTNINHGTAKETPARQQQTTAPPVITRRPAGGEHKKSS